MEEEWWSYTENVVLGNGRWPIGLKEEPIWYFTQVSDETSVCCALETYIKPTYKILPTSLPNLFLSSTTIYNECMYTTFINRHCGENAQNKEQLSYPLANVICFTTVF